MVHKTPKGICGDKEVMSSSNMGRMARMRVAYNVARGTGHTALMGCGRGLFYGLGWSWFCIFDVYYVYIIFFEGEVGTLDCFVRLF